MSNFWENKQKKRFSFSGKFDKKSAYPLTKTGKYAILYNGVACGKMKNCKITVMRKTEYPDLMKKYENRLEHTCDIKVGQTFISVGGARPEGLCESAWESMEKFVKELSSGGGNFFDGWMKNEKSAMISCNDGFRPVSF